MKSLPVETSKLWRLIFGTPQIDPPSLASAVECEAQRRDLDYRTRLLIRDSLSALRSHWDGFESWYSASPARGLLCTVEDELFERTGFESIGDRLMSATKRETVEQFLRELGSVAHGKQAVFIGGAGALILLNELNRQTLDVDFVDEVPASLRSQHALLDDLKRRYGLQLTHFQSHYLPDDWKSRVRSLGAFGHLDVFLVDPMDIFVGKLFSARTKDRDDVRLLAPRFEKARIEARLVEAGQRLAADPRLRENAEKNWYIVFGESLPQLS